MLLRFTKMQGLGNDFVVFDMITQRFNLQHRHIRKIADRQFGIGCDQVLTVEAPRDPDVDFRYRIFNADGSEVEQCGNGARCFAKYVRDKKLTGKKVLKVETLGGTIELFCIDKNQFRVDMGVPQLDPAEVPFLLDSSDICRKTLHRIEVDQRQFEIGVVSMGNPHAVVIVDDVDTFDVASIGAAIGSHRRFPEGVNVGFMSVTNRQQARLRVFERGVGETLACGTGACAAVVSGRQGGLLDPLVQVQLPGGELTIEWPGEGHSVNMTGPAANVFEGQILL